MRGCSVQEGGKLTENGSVLGTSPVRREIRWDRVGDRLAYYNAASIANTIHQTPLFARGAL